MTHAIKEGRCQSSGPHYLTLKPLCPRVVHSGTPVFLGGFKNPPLQCYTVYFLRQSMTMLSMKARPYVGTGQPAPFIYSLVTNFLTARLRPSSERSNMGKSLAITCTVG